jgi:hypothetical protein
MAASEKRPVALYVDRACRQWIVRDPEGSFWILPSVEHPWDERQPFHLTDETDLQSVPGHYRDLLELPF